MERDPIRVLIVDDHALIRAGLRGLLAALPEVQVIGEAVDGRQALELVESLRPDVMMTDISMPGIDGLELTAAVARGPAPTKVLILSMHTERAYADKAMRAGAAGYLVKDSGTAEIELAIRAVARGESYLSPAVTKHVVAGYARMAEAEANDPGPLTPRQRDVLKLIAAGLTTKAIAHRLDISVKTADTHRVQLMERLGIHEIAGLVRYAIRTGLVDHEA
ncbi:response regulator [Paludisphaera mucosa]|uniref:Response regulator transcription factor n=1 Tax=Paludisphaera mucosa TaxID=3030827 RepID=A0ABT6FDR2_9BACT|nr:response regulator transcription factor [Paludisphaera mucosa]MDG3005720.1 response regulator transcription factor [Paludisphaera mucosa]